MNRITCNGNWFDIQKIPQTYQNKHFFIDVQNSFDPNLDNIYIQCEPEVIIKSETYLLENYKKYTKIFTFNKKVLENCENSVKYNPSCTWILPQDYENINPKEKSYAISNLAGTKNFGATGHILRQVIHHHQHLFSSFPITFFRSIAQMPIIKDYGNNPLIEKKLSDKLQLFKNFQFSIVIENSKQDNYFSEKLIDCLITKTIPIYYGCPNIKEYFDTTGWILIEKDSYEDIIHELLSKLLNLHPDYYQNNFDTVEENYKKAIYYSDYYQNLFR